MQSVLQKPPCEGTTSKRAARVERIGTLESILVESCRMVRRSNTFQWFHQALGIARNTYAPLNGVTLKGPVSAVSTTLIEESNVSFTTRRYLSVRTFQTLNVFHFLRYRAFKNNNSKKVWYVSHMSSGKAVMTSMTISATSSGVSFRNWRWR